MEYFGILGFMLAAIAYYRIDRLEKRLKELEVLDKDFRSE